MVEEVIVPKRRPRKIIGEEGSRKQTLIVFLLLLIIGLLLYLPGRFPLPQLSINRPEWGGGEVITIRKSQPKADRPLAEKPKIEELIAGQTGDFGIFIKSVNDPEELKLGEDKIMTAASVIKLPVLIVYYQAVDSGKIDPEEEYVLQEADRWEYGTGSLQYQPAGTKYTYKEIAQLVANQSDNMGAEVLIKKLGGYAKAQQLVNKLGLTKTNLRENEMTTAEAGNLFLQLAQGKLLKPASREELFNNLTKTINEDRLPVGVPDAVRVVHKFGSEAGMVNDCGLVESKNPYVICILTTGVNSGEAEPLLPQISAAAWNWLGDN